MLRSHPQRRARLALLSLASALLGAAPASIAPPDDRLAERVIAISAAYLGTPYVRDPLGEGSGPDPDPLIDRHHVDCVTFVEQVLAEALAPTPGDILPTLTRIRYREGRLGLAYRNHFFVADWAPNNRRLLSDVTTAVGGAAVRRALKTIDRASLLRSRGCPPEQCRIAPERLTVAYIPRASVADRLARFPRVAVVAFVTDRPGIDVTHTGFVLTRGGEVYLRHGSQRRGQVIEERLLDHLARASARVIGLTLYAVHSPLALPGP